MIYLKFHIVKIKNKVQNTLANIISANLNILNQQPNCEVNFNAIETITKKLMPEKYYLFIKKCKC